MKSLHRSGGGMLLLALLLVSSIAGCASEEIIGAVARVPLCPVFPRLRSLRIDVVSDAPDVRAARTHSTECIDAPEMVDVTTPMQVMAALAARGYIADDIDDDAHARIKLVGLTQPGCPTGVPDTRAFCALSTRPLDESLIEDGGTLIVDFFCGDAAVREADCVAFGVE